MPSRPLQFKRVLDLSAAAGTNRLFFTPSKGMKLRIVNMSNDNSGCRMDLEIMDINGTDDTDATISLFHRRVALAGRDVRYEANKPIEFDGSQKIRFTFANCTSGDFLRATMGIE